MGRRVELSEDMVLIDRKSFDLLVAKLNVVYDYVTDKLEKYRQREDSRLVTMQEVILYLRLGKTTAYDYVKRGILTPANHTGKMLFRLGDIKASYENGDIHTTKQYLQNLIDNHNYVEYERLDLKSDK